MSNMTVVTAVHERSYVCLIRVRRKRREVEDFSVTPRRERRCGVRNLEFFLGFGFEHTRMSKLFISKIMY